MAYVAFDLEISTEIPEGCDDWKTLRPLGISCAAAYPSDSRMFSFWHGAKQADGCFTERMTPAEVISMINELSLWYSRGFNIVTWNGLGFDFDILAEECQNSLWARNCRLMALDHTDMAFQMFAEKGFMISLDTCAKALGLAGKTEGMTGAQAPQMWKQGRAEQDKVLEYVIQDVRTTAKVYEAILKQRRLYWTTKKGTRSYYPWQPQIKDGRLLTVRESLRLPEPDTSWMVDHWERKKFYGWTGYKRVQDLDSGKE